jgi:hypothetical protein
MTAPIQERI